MQCQRSRCGRNPLHGWLALCHNDLRSFVRVRLVTILASCLFLYAVGANLSTALADRAPLVKAQLRSLNESFADFNYLTGAMGFGQLGQLLSLTTSQYTRGLDGTRPVTLWVDGAADTYRWLLVLPTSDLPTFLKSMENVWGLPRPLGDGILEVVGKRTLALRPVGPWILVSESAASLEVPALALEQIVSVDVGERDLIVDIYPANLPELLRQRAYQEVRRQTEKQLLAISGRSATANWKRALVREAWDQLGQIVHDAEYLQLGWTADEKLKKVNFTCELRAKSDSLTDRRLGQFQVRPSQMATILQTGATSTWNAIGELPPEDIPRIERLIETTMLAAVEELATSKRLQDEATRQAAIQFTQSVLQTCAHSMREGRFDGAGVLHTGGQELAGVAGAYVTSPEPLQQTLQTLARQPRVPNPTWQLSSNLNARTGLGVYQFLLNTPADAALTNAFGRQITLFVGIAENQIFVALGKDGAHMIDAAYQQNQQRPPTSVLPFHSQVTIAPALRFYQRVSADQKALKLLAAFSEQDRLTVQSMPVEQGVRFVIDADQGVLQAVGLALVPSFGRFDRTQRIEQNRESRTVE